MIKKEYSAQELSKMLKDVLQLCKDSGYEVYADSDNPDGLLCGMSFAIDERIFLL